MSPPSHATESPSTHNSQNSKLANSSGRSNGGNQSTETESRARRNAPSEEDKQAQYQQYLANMLSNPSMLFPMPTTSNQVTPGQAALPSPQGPPGNFYNQSGGTMVMYPSTENHARRVLEEQLTSTRNDLKKTKEEVVNLKKENAMLRREAEAYKNLYDALKEEKDGEKEDAMKRSP